MDAQSLHKHIEGSTKQRIHAKSTDDSKQLFKNEEAIKSELHKEEFDHDGDGVVSLMEELESVDSVKEVAEEAAAKLESKTEDDPEEKVEEKNDSLPQAEILTMHEEKKPSFNAFSSHHASAPVPRQNSQAPIEEAKPVKDNTNAIILILLIAILIIAVAIFGVVVLGDYNRRGKEANQSREAVSGTVEGIAVDDSDDDYSSIVGKWRNIAEESSSCLVVYEDGDVSWYNECDNNSGDHYSGDADFTSDQNAIDDLGITKERAARMLGISESELKLENTFVIKVYPGDYSVNGNSSQMPSEIKLLVTKSTEHEINVYDYRYGELSILSDKTTEDDEQS